MSKMIKLNERNTIAKAIAVEIIDGQAETKTFEVELKGSRTIDSAQKLIDRLYKDKGMRPLVESVEVVVTTYQLDEETFKFNAEKITE